MSLQLLEIMPELFTRSEVLVWNFAEITSKDQNKNIQTFMREQEKHGKNPRDAFHRQEFNNRVLARTGARYLIGRYGEDRHDILRGSHIADEGRTYHLAIDIFSRHQEPVFAPCDGEIVRSDYEPGLHNYGNYLILQPADTSLPYLFFGHLSADRRRGGQVQAGEQIARLGSFVGLENGGWSIHLHLQLLTELPPVGQAPIGYSTLTDLPENRRRFPDPQSIFPNWKIKR
ncbi:MAG TPA: peptidoglycan DD-metalloendopeptidase family protein [Candidatus Saccharimonadales bacterium]|nr:peptidoglycan DD-metalloendopeptidase family protein [Candidatus Saccharimonadales bacterium]